MTLPKGYQKRLQRFDPLLRMRWSAAKQSWLLERKTAYERKDFGPRPTWMGEDTYTQFRDGYFHLDSYHPQRLPSVDNLIEQLQKFDTWNMKLNASEIADYQEAREMAQREAQREAFMREQGDVASDIYDSYKWKAGERVSVPA